MDSIVTMIHLETKTHLDYSRQLADRMRAIRRRQRLSQARLAERSGVSLGSLKRFERTGEVSLSSFIKLCMALGRENEIDQLLSANEYTSIEEVIADARRHAQ